MFRFKNESSRYNLLQIVREQHNFLTKEYCFGKSPLLFGATLSGIQIGEWYKL